MKAAIISDTHDNTPAIAWMINYLHEKNISLAFHAGDIVNPGNIALFEKTFNGELHFVFGNNDGEHGRILRNISQSEKVFCYFEAMDAVFHDRRIFMNHFSEISELVAQNNLFDIVIGGHDHKYRVKKFGKTVFVNPGSTSKTDFILGRSSKDESSFVVIDLVSLETQRIMVDE